MIRYILEVSVTARTPTCLLCSQRDHLVLLFVLVTIAIGIPDQPSLPPPNSSNKEPPPSGETCRPYGRHAVTESHTDNTKCRITQNMTESADALALRSKLPCANLSTQSITESSRRMRRQPPMRRMYVRHTNLLTCIFVFAFVCEPIG